MANGHTTDGWVNRCKKSFHCAAVLAMSNRLATSNRKLSGCNGSCTTTNTWHDHMMDGVGGWMEWMDTCDRCKLVKTMLAWTVALAQDP